MNANGTGIHIQKNDLYEQSRDNCLSPYSLNY